MSLGLARAVTSVAAADLRERWAAGVRRWRRQACTARLLAASALCPVCRVPVADWFEAFM